MDNAEIERALAAARVAMRLSVLSFVFSLITTIAAWYNLAIKMGWL